MTSGVLSTALSGLFAQQRAIDARASNIANVSTAGQVAENGVEPDIQVYQPIDSVNTSVVTPDGGVAGVRSDFVTRDPASSVIFAPNSQLANEEGLVEVPNVSLEEEIIGLQFATTAYKANLAVIRTDQELSDELLDIFS